MPCLLYETNTRDSSSRIEVSPLFISSPRPKRPSPPGVYFLCHLFMVAGAATSERFSVLPPPRERPPPPSPPPTSLSRPPLTLAACCEAATTSSLLNSFPGTSTCAAQRPASATSAAAAAATTTAEVSVGVGVARARADDGGGGGGGHGCVLCHRRRRPAVHANDGALRARHARTAGRWRRRRRRLIEINHFFKIKLF